MHRKLCKYPQAGIKIDGRNVNNLRYADNTTIMAEGGVICDTTVKW